AVRAARRGAVVGEVYVLALLRGMGVEDASVTACAPVIPSRILCGSRLPGERPRTMYRSSAGGLTGADSPRVYAGAFREETTQCPAARAGSTRVLASGCRDGCRSAWAP